MKKGKKVHSNDTWSKGQKDRTFRENMGCDDVFKCLQPGLQCNLSRPLEALGYVGIDN